MQGLQPFEAVAIWVVFGIAIVGLLYALVLRSQIMREDKGTEKMQEVWNENQRNGTVMKGFEESLEFLQTDYVDLYLIHWPVKKKYNATWKVIEEIYR